MTTKLVVVGATGRTGSLAAEVARENDTYGYVGGVASEKQGESIVGPEGARALFEKADAAVDFSTPDATRLAADLARETGTPLATGTTALDDEASEALDDAAETVPVVRASNFARGVNVFWEVVERAAALLPTPTSRSPRRTTAANATRRRVQRSPPSNVSRTPLANANTYTDAKERHHAATR